MPNSEISPPSALTSAERLTLGENSVRAQGAEGAGALCAGCGCSHGHCWLCADAELSSSE